MQNKEGVTWEVANSCLTLKGRAERLCQTSSGILSQAIPFRVTHCHLPTATPLEGKTSCSKRGLSSKSSFSPSWGSFRERVTLTNTGWLETGRNNPTQTSDQLLPPPLEQPSPAGTVLVSLCSVGKGDEELPMGCGTICWRWDQENGLE